MATTMAETLAASLPAPAPAQTTNTVPVAESIPASMSKLIDIEAEIPIEVVQLDGLVVSKIVKHGQETHGTATGLLVGIDLNGTLEVSNCFALPGGAVADGDEERQTRSARYQAAMLRALKDIQRDDQPVGFYQTCRFGSFLNGGFVELATRYSQLRHGGIAVIHDVTQSARGHAHLRAYRLSASFKEVYKKGRFTSEQLAESGLTITRMVDEIPIVVRTSPLLGRVLEGMKEGGYEVTELAGGEGVVEEIVERVEMYRNEEQNVGYVTRQIARERGRAEAYVQKRKEENAHRVSQGLAPLPEEDVSRMFKIPSEPSRLESVLLLSQLDGITGRMASGGAGLDMVKLYANNV